MTIIAILLDQSQDNIFYPGQNVTGHIRVETNEEIKMRGIRLEVHGDARVRWSTGSGQSRRTYTGHENFIELIVYLTGSGNKDSEMTLKPGVHTFPLRFLLPDTAPSSFDGLHGSIKYKVQAIVDLPWKIDDSAEIQIAVVRLLNLNHEHPLLRGPIVVQGKKPMVGCWYYGCCIKGLPEIELTMNKGCFVPGEMIILNGQVINKTNTKISDTTIDFMQEIQFCATSRGQIYQYQTLGSVKRPPIEIGSTDTWSDVTFTVPPVVASRLDGSKIINISYFIRVKADFVRGCADSVIRKDIIIGHIPLQSNSQFDGPITTQPYTSPFHPGAPLSDQHSYSAVHGTGWNQDYNAASVDHKKQV